MKINRRELKKIYIEWLYGVNFNFSLTEWKLLCLRNGYSPEELIKEINDSPTWECLMILYL